MKKQITITQAEFQKAVTETLDFMEQAAKNNPKNSNPMAVAVAGLLYSAFAAKLTLTLFQDDETLEIEENSK